MTLDASKLIIPGRGTVLFAPVGTQPVNIDAFNLNVASTFKDWDIAHTSKENAISFSKDGGETTTLGSWEVPNLKVSKTPTMISFTTGKLQMDKENFERCFGIAGNSWDAATGAFKVTNLATTDLAVMVIMIDGENNRGGWYFPKCSVSMGDFPEVDAENFYEFQLAGNVLADPATGENFRVYQVRPYSATTAA